MEEIVIGFRFRLILWREIDFREARLCEVESVTFIELEFMVTVWMELLRVLLDISLIRFVMWFVFMIIGSFRLFLWMGIILLCFIVFVVRLLFIEFIDRGLWFLELFGIWECSFVISFIVSFFVILFVEIGLVILETFFIVIVVFKVILWLLLGWRFWVLCVFIEREFMEIMFGFNLIFLLDW